MQYTICQWATNRFRPSELTKHHPRCPLTSWVISPDTFCMSLWFIHSIELKYDSMNTGAATWLHFYLRPQQKKKPHVIETVWWSSSIQVCIVIGIHIFHFWSSLLWYSMWLARYVINCISITDPTIFQWWDYTGCYVRDDIGIIYQTPL